jgi:ketosteroid isomerase-like protein
MDIQKNKEMIKEGYRLFQAGDIGNLLDRYHDDAEWAGPENEFVPFAGNFHGKGGIAQFFTKLNATVQATRFEPQQFIAEGDKVVVTGVASWRARTTGRSYDSGWVHVFTVSGGKVARFESYFDTAAVERALYVEQPGQASAATHLHH